MTSGSVVRAADVRADRTKTGAIVRTLLDAGSGSPHPIRRLVDVAPRSQFDGIAGTAGELWFVIDGSGQLDVQGHPGLSLSRDRGLWIPPGARYRARADSPADLRLDVVSLPALPPPSAQPAAPPPSAQPAAPLATAGSANAASTAADPRVPLTCDFGDCEVERTGDRQFRVLFGPGRGCAVATQFVGEIPPGRAPEHSHPYDEVVLVLEGEGVVHVGGADHALSPGTCTHLPPGQPHCLENTGSVPMRVLGVFHPADSPAAKLEERRSE